ncbi:MAG: MptD family putative ECF transporter S component [Candidatus Woesearchaeota archaeon]|nr:MptD family putative ECF transporter S component [Candidatus Woesearchaeota archaeon]
MLQKFSVRELILIALLASAKFVLDFVFGAGIVASTGIPLSSVFFSAITAGVFVFLMVKLVPKLGTFTLFFLIYSILEMPTALGGAPGFWPKIPINVLTGLAGDVFLFWTNYKNWSVFAGFYILATINIAVFVFFLWLLGLPGVDKTLGLMHIMILVFWILGTVGILIGMQIFKKIRNWSVIRQVRSE